MVMAGAKPVLQTETEVVIVIVQPPVMLPTSTLASSTTKRLQVPFALAPLKTLAKVADPAVAGLW